MTPDENDDSELNNVPEHFPDATTRRVGDTSAENDASQLLRLASRDPKHPLHAALKEVHEAEVARKKLEVQLERSEEALRETAQQLLQYSHAHPQLVIQAEMLSQDLAEMRKRYWDLDQQRKTEIAAYRKYQDQLIGVELEAEHLRTSLEVLRKQAHELEQIAQEVFELRNLSRLYVRFPRLLKPYWQAVSVSILVSFIFAFGFFCAALLFYHRP